MNSTLKPIFDRSLLVLGGALIAATLALLVFTGGQKEQASTPAGAWSSRTSSSRQRRSPCR
jgi:hypothetical protein